MFYFMSVLYISNCSNNGVYRLVDFVIGLVNSVLDLPDGQVNCFLKKNCEINSACQKVCVAS